MSSKAKDKATNLYNEKLVKKSSNNEKTSSSIVDDKEDLKSLPGKISFIGRILAFFSRTFARFTFWLSNKLLNRLIGRKGVFSKILGSRLTAIKDRLVSKIALIFGTILGIYFSYKGLKTYVKNRKYRKNIREIDQLKQEIRELKTELNSEIKDYRDQIKDINSKN